MISVIIKNSFSLFLIITYIFIGKSFAQTDLDEPKSPLEKFAITSEAIPYEIELMVDHLKQQELTQDQLELFITRTRQINSDLKSIQKKDLMFLLKSETYKGILTSQYLNLKNKLQVSSNLYSTAEQKLKTHKLIYSKFSTWVIEALLKDFTPYVSDGFINKYQNIKRSDTKGLIRARKILKVIKYNSPLLESFLTLTPERFNKLSTDIILDVFDRISKKSYYFLTYQGKLTKIEETILFSIPEILPQPKEVKPLKSIDLQEESKLKVEEAKKAIQAIEGDDLSGASEEIDNILK
jgi:ribosomal protein S13